MKRAILLGLIAAPLFAMSLTLSAPATVASAQTQSSDELITKVFSLKHASAAGVMGVIGNLMVGSPGTLAVDDRTNSILVRSTHSHCENISKLITQLDRPAENGKAGTETRVIAVRFRSASALERVVKMHLGREGQFAINQRTNSIVINDNPRNIDKIIEVITRLDVDPRALRLECWLLGSGQGTPTADHPAVAPIGVELKQMGLTNYGVFSHAAVRALEGHEFKLEQNFSDRQLRMLALSGDIRLSQDTGQAIVNLSAGLRMDLDGENAETSINLTTTVKSRVGDLVLLGLAPTGNDDSKPIVLVVRISQ